MPSSCPMMAPIDGGWLCLSMSNRFYAAVEIRDNPSIANKPVAVGGMQMISTSNYEARKYGVRAAMPGFIALKLCPHLIFVRHNYSKYKEVAEQVNSHLFSLFLFES
jgi:DNA polymerase kappa